MNYEEQLQTKQWDVRRRQILERDDHCCQDCLRGKNKRLPLELHVHHKSYINGLMAWEYSDDYLITLCDECHQKVHGLLEDHRDERNKPAFVYGVRNFTSRDTKSIAEVMRDHINSLING